MAPFGDLLHVIRAVAADPAKNRAALLAVLWRRDHPENPERRLTAGQAKTVLLALGLVEPETPTPLPQLPPKARTTAYRRAEEKT